MRVLLISHTCQSRREGQPKAMCLAQQPDVELCLLVPDRWKVYGKWSHAEPALSNAFRYEVGRIRLPWAGPAQNYLHVYPKLAKLIRDFKPEIIDVWEEPWSLCSAHAAWLRDRLCPDARLISETEQNIDKTLPPPFERLRRYTLGRADFCVGRSSEAVEVLRRKGYRGPAAVVPNAVDAELFTPADRAACRRQLGLPADEFIAGYVGRLVVAKGIAELIAATAKVSGAHGVLVGDGPDRAAFEAQAAREAPGRVHFAGPQPLDQLPTWMNALDVLVLPSRTTASWKEQFGRVIIEAHACGVPVIGSSSGAIPEVVGDAGLVFAESDANALADAIEKLSDDPALRQAMGERGYTRVHERFTWQRVAEQMAGIYRQAMAGETQSDAPVDREATALPTCEVSA